MLVRLGRIAALAAVLACAAAPDGAAQTAQATPKDVAAIRGCAEKYAQNVNEAERRCIFTIVGDPCTKTRLGQSSQGAASCYRIEQEIWDEILNENFRTLRDGLDDGQKDKLKEMQRAWIAYRNTTCEFYYDKIQGTMATEMTAACLARETARRALLLKFFQGL
ncbi:MAG TPA: lysozyme inhibitor LprI family protein [Xanthobacteraceae bacterium]